MFICMGCGSLELKPAARCQKCGAVMKSEEELAHDWVGRPGTDSGFALLCRQRGRMAFMDPEIAREIPYCPFCRKEIGQRPEVPAIELKSPPP